MFKLLQKHTAGGGGTYNRRHARRNLRFTQRGFAALCDARNGLQTIRAESRLHVPCVAVGARHCGVSAGGRAGDKVGSFIAYEALAKWHDGCLEKLDSAMEEFECTQKEMVLVCVSKPVIYRCTRRTSEFCVAGNRVNGDKGAADGCCWGGGGGVR